MAYPISYENERIVEFPLDYKLFRQEIFDTLKSRFKESGINAIEEEGNALRFRGDIFRYIWNGWNFLNGISSARVELLKSRKGVVISYTIYFWEAFVLALFFTAIPVIFYFKANYALAMVLAIWGLLFTGNFIFSYIRFNKFIKKIALNAVVDADQKNVYG